MAQTASGPNLLKTTGETVRALYGCAGGSGTSTVVTLPAQYTVLNVIVGGATSSTAPFCATVSANTFTVTTASNDLFTYIAFVKGGF